MISLSSKSVPGELDYYWHTNTITLIKTETYLGINVSNPNLWSGKRFESVQLHDWSDSKATSPHDSSPCNDSCKTRLIRMPSCVVDFFFIQLQLYDGRDTNSNLLAAVTGRSLADLTITTYKSSEHHMLLHLTTDESESGRGFQATFELGRPGVFHG